MRKISFYVYTNKNCTHHNTLNEALEIYNSVEMKELKDDVFLGVESDDISPTGGVCFDVIHKFFDANILINDWLNHKDDADVTEKVSEIIRKVPIRYQFVSNLLNGVLISFSDPWVKSYTNETMADAWTEAHISVYTDNGFSSVGWKENNWNTIGNYQWQYPTVASYIHQLNVKFTDENGYESNRDIDPREFLDYHKLAFTDISDF